MNKVYTFSTKTIVIGLFGVLALGFSLGVLGTTPSEPQETTKPEPTPALIEQKDSQETSTIKQQVKDCQNTIRLETEALDLSSEIISISGSVIVSIANGDIDVDQIEKDTDRVNTINEKISQLTNKITPLTEKCFKQ